MSTPPRCFYCELPAVVFCDYVVETAPLTSCDRAICGAHRRKVGHLCRRPRSQSDTIDYCREHDEDANMRPTDNVKPTNAVTCAVCGAAWAIVAGADDMREYRAFKQEHELCAALGMAAGNCTTPGCESTGIGPSQRCPAHGGKRERRDVRG